MTTNKKNENSIDESNDLLFDPYDINENDMTFKSDYKNLYCSDHNRYLIPIFLNNEETSFIGNGVLIDNYLITAAHVAQSRCKKENYHYLFYKYDNNMLCVNDTSIIHDGSNVEDKDGIHDDLLVYRLDNKYEFFKFYSEKEPLKKSLKLYGYPYSFNPFKNKPTQSGNECWVEDLCAMSFDNKTLWKNCFRINYPCGGLQEGNSGCAIFRKNVLYGILLGGDKYGTHGCNYTILDAKYIRQCINDYEKRNQK